MTKHYGQFDEADALDGNEIVPVLQDAETRRTTAQAIADLAAGGVSSVNGETGAVTLDAEDIAFTPNGSIAATDVQAAIQEVRDEVSSGGGAWGSITGTLSDQTDLQAELDAKQAADADLSAIAGLSPTNDDILQRKAGAWTNRSLAQLSSDLHLGTAATADIGSGPGEVLSGSDSRLNRVSKLRNWGHSWFVYGPFDGTINRFSSMLSVPPQLVDSYAVSGSTLTISAWPAILQVQSQAPGNDPNGPNPFDPSSRPAAPYLARTGLGFCGYGLNDLLPVPEAFDAQRGTYRAWPHALRTWIALDRNGGSFDTKHDIFEYSSGFAPVASGRHFGDQYVETSANGETITATLPDDFPGGYFDWVFEGQKDVYGKLAAQANAAATTCTLTTGGAQVANGDMIDIGGEQVRVTSGGGTNSLTFTPALASTHAAGTEVTAAETTYVTFDGTADIGTPDPVLLAAQGSTFRGVPIVVRFALTADDAGKTIVATTGGMAASSNDRVKHVGCFIEAKTPPPAIVANVARFAYFWFWSLAWPNRVQALNALTESVVEEFDGPIAIADLDAALNRKTAVSSDPMNDTDDETTITVTWGDELPEVGDQMRAASADLLTYEDTQVLAVTGSPGGTGTITLKRGMGVWPKVEHDEGFTLYWREPYLADCVHPGPTGAGLLATELRDTLNSMTFTVEETAQANGYTKITPSLNGSPLFVPGQRGLLRPTNGKLSMSGFHIDEPIIITALGVYVKTAGASGSTIRMVLAADDNGAPSTVLLDAGTIDGTQTGYLKKTCRKVQLPGNFWVGAAPQGSPATQPTLLSVIDRHDGQFLPPATDPGGDVYGGARIRASGNVSVDNEANPQSMTVTHGLSITPTVLDIDLFATNAWDSGTPSTAQTRPFYVDNIGSTTFDIHTYKATGAGSTIGWRADCSQNVTEFGRTAWCQTGVTGEISEISPQVAGEAIAVFVEYVLLTKDLA